jgi:hypothetical protein
MVALLTKVFVINALQAIKQLPSMELEAIIKTVLLSER